MKNAKDLENRLFAEQVSLLFKQYPLGATAGMLVTVAVGVTLWEKVPTGYLLGWILAQNFFLISGLILVWSFQKLPSPSSKATSWFRGYMAIIVPIALFWGSLIHFANFEIPSGHQNFLIITVVGLASAALILALPILSAYYSYLSLAFLPLLIWFFSQNQQVFFVLGVLSVLYYSLLVLAGRKLNIHFVNNIRLRFEKADLLNEVKSLNENLEQRVVEKTAALSASEERFDLAMQGASDGLWDWDIKNGTAYFSPRWKAMLGFQEWEIGDSPREWRRRLHKEDRRRVLSLIKAHLDGKTDSYESTHRVRRADGKYLWVLDRGRAVYGEDGKPQRMVGTQVDVSDHKSLEEKIKSANIKLKHEIKERVQAQQELAHLAKHDPLTELPNRILFYEQLQEAIKRAEVEDDVIAVLLVDLDNFKHVNDTLGHPVGDKLLVDVANRLNSIANKNYFLSRFGGDEFIVILESNTDKFLIDAYAGEIIDLLSQPFYLQDHEIRIGCSIGITLFPDHGKEPDSLVRDADIAMYYAKDQGRNTFRYFTEEMDEAITEKVSLRNMLHGALDRSEFEIHYQPQVDIQTTKVTGLEALLRWTPTDGVAVAPDKFIPLLEETGLVFDVGSWVLKQACEQIVFFHQLGLSDLKMAVNLSPRQFLREDLADVVQSILKETGLESKYLELEITENIFLENLDQINKTMSRLKVLGINITLDDFGTGYSSLAYLKRFPINGVKIDKEFVKDIIDNSDSRELVTAIIAMANGLNVKTLVAEGVESQAQLQLLRKLGCPTYQGFFYSKPLKEKALRAFLLKGPREISI